ncbi:MAG TPA: hypothetical protein VF576_08880 [Rubricoccaceae bacterium]|jgi:hypothetical protein
MRLTEPAFWNETPLGRRLRWAFVVPGAAAAALLSTLVLRFLILQNVGPDDVIVQTDAEGLRRIEWWLGPFAHALALVWAGAYIAPAHRFATGMALAGVWVGVLLTLLVLSHTGALAIEPGPPLRAVLSAAGALVGVWAAKVLDRTNELT